jgi:NADH-quinone oxidoreductase subunit F
MIYEIGGGMAGPRPLKAVQAGGPSAGCVSAAALDLRIDAADRPGETISMGTGGIIVLDEAACMVDMARFLLDFFVEESCGKCVPCREGTKHMLRILTRICRGQGTGDDLGLLERLARHVKLASLCGLGAVAPDPVLAALQYFRDEFQSHIRDKQCPAGVCRVVAGQRVGEEALCGGELARRK